MVYLVAAFSLMLHLIVWGTGLAILVVPPRFRKFWAFFVCPAGIALQSAVVWIAAVHTDLPGTGSYGILSLVVPLGLFLWAWRLHGWSLIREGVQRAAPIHALGAVLLGALMFPASAASRALTSMSLGSCDAADYAAGARVLMEFARGDRTGFLGLTEVVQLHSVDNFFDYWTRLNHFTPSALLALGNSVFSWEFYSTVSVMAAVLVAGALPLVFWVSRSAFRLGPLAAGWVAFIYGCSPLTLYSVWHVALGQTLAAIGIALLTWTAVMLWRRRPDLRSASGYLGLVAVAAWILLGSYNFILLVCLVPAVAYAGGQALWSREWRRLLRWAIALLIPMGAVLAVFYERTAGLVERFLLLQEYDFGWKIPVIVTPGWFGLVADIHLNPLPIAPRLFLTVGLTGLIAAAIFSLARRRAPVVWLAVGTVLPIVGGYAFLQVRAAALGTNASYDAYKLLAVFYPLILPALCLWLSRGLLRSGTWRVVGAVAVLVVSVGNLRVAYSSAERMQAPPLIVDPEMAEIQQIESRAEIRSVNLRIADFWTRLWTNAFLLRIEQYFLEHTYEGRRNTELKGEWDLLGGLVQVRLPPRSRDGLVVGSRYSLVRTSSPLYLQTRLKDGWYERETAPRSAPWRWTQGDASIEVINPHDEALQSGFSLRARGFVARDVQLWVNGKLERRIHVGTELQTFSFPPIELRPGSNIVELRSSVPPSRAGPQDARLLGLMVQGVDFNVLPRGSPVPP